MSGNVKRFFERISSLQNTNHSICRGQVSPSLNSRNLTKGNLVCVRPLQFNRTWSNVHLQYTKDFHLEHMNNNARQYVTASYGKIINHTQNVPPSQTSLWFWRTNRTRTWAVGVVSIFHTTMIWSVRNVTQTIAWPNLSGSSSEVGVQFSKVYSSISCNTSATCASPGKKTPRHTWKHRRKGVRGIFHRGSGLPP